MDPHRPAPRGARTGAPRTARTRSTSRTRSSLAPTSSSAVPARPGVLVARRELFRNRVPDVTRRRHRRLRQPARARLPRRPGAPRGGRDARRSSSRSGPGSSFQLKEAVGVEAIRRREEDFIEPGDRVVARRARDPGPRQPGAAAAVDRVVHRSATTGATSTTTSSSRVLNDLFGIQSRGGCSCAGPYGHRLLGIDIETLARVRARDRARLRGDQARLGPGELQLLHQRGGVRLPRARGRARRARGLAARCPGTASSPRPGCGATPPARRSRRCPSTTCAFAADGRLVPGASPHASARQALADHLAEAERILADPDRGARRPPAADRTVPEVGDGLRVRCAGSGSRTRSARRSRADIGQGREKAEYWYSAISAD